MTTEEVRLVSGVYSDGTNTRTLLGVFNGKCVYGHEEPKTGAWPVTSCSVRTFIKSVGVTPVRTLTPAEAIRLAERMEPYSTRRRSNRWERAMLHCGKGRFAILAALEPAPSDCTVKIGAPTRPAGAGVRVAAGPVLRERLCRLLQGFAKIVRLVRLGHVFARTEPANPAAVSRFVRLNS